MSATNPICSKCQDLEPVSNTVKEAYKNYFDQLVKELKIDVALNKELSEEYYSNLNNIDKANKSIRTKNIWKWILLIFFIFPFILLNNQVKEHKEYVAKLEEQANALEDKLIKQLEPLWAELSWNNINKNVLAPNLPDYTFSRIISHEDSNVWNELINVLTMGKNESFTDMISGTIYNHPFLLYTIKTQTMVPVTYTGSTSISYRDSEGNMQTEILTASHVEPMPVYNRENYISLKSNLVEKLEYSNSASLKSLRKVNKAYKNSGQEKMDNEEFDRLFPTTRNDELAFRVMFTVLTQEKFVELFNTAGQYSLFKSGLYTTSYVPSQIKKKSKKASYVGSMPSHYIDYHFYEMYGDDSYDLDELKKQKSDSVKEFIKAFGFMQLPFANMPVIARETYKESDKPTKDKYNGIQNEVLANLNFERNFGGRYDTEVILSSKNNTTFTFNKKSCILTELDADYFIEEHTTVSEYVRGSHGGATVIIHIVVYHPRTAKYYLVQCHDFDKKYDYFTKSGARVVDGVYYKLFDHKPTEADLKKEFCK